MPLLPRPGRPWGRDSQRALAATSCDPWSGSFASSWSLPALVGDPGSLLTALPRARAACLTDHRPPCKTLRTSSRCRLFGRKLMRQPGNSTEGIQRHRVSSLGELACSRKLSRLIRGRVCAARSPRLHAWSAQDPAGASFRQRATSAECLQHSSCRQHARLFGSNVVRCLSILLHSDKPSVAIRARGRE